MNSFTRVLTNDQAIKLRGLLQELGFEFAPKPYTIFFGQKNKLSVAVYEKGPKVLVQGKGVEEFVQFELEPRILGEAKLGYEEVHTPEMFQPHFGVDESGKGDFFGPLVISGVYVDAGIARKFLDAGVQDSKRIGSDARIRALAESIRKDSLGLVDTVLIGPERYNDLYEKFGNLNKLLGWGHARVIENLLERKPDCPRSLSDQFADARVIQQSLLQHGRKINIEQRTKAESDVAVAAASILAKTTRDAEMCRLHGRFPQYGFDEHKGYPTPQHLRALRRHGVCEVYRRSFAPVREILDREGLGRGASSASSLRSPSRSAPGRNSGWRAAVRRSRRA